MAGAALALTGCAAGPPEPDNPAGVRIDRSAGDVGNANGLRGIRPPDRALPGQAFTDTAGRPWTFGRGDGRTATLVFFGYTNCADSVCNTVLADLASALTRVQPRVRERVRTVFVTTDPARDSPKVISEYLARFDPAFVGLTADAGTVLAAARSLGVAVTEASPLPGGGYEIGHGGQVYGFGPDGRAKVVWRVGTPVADLKHDFERLVNPT